MSTSVNVVYANSRENVAHRTYQSYDILIPTQFADLGDQLFKFQQSAIDMSAVYGVQNATLVDIVGWTTNHPRLPCAFINLYPTRSKELSSPYKRYATLIESNGLVVAGIFIVSLQESMRLRGNCLINMDHLQDGLIAKLERQVSRYLT